MDKAEYVRFPAYLCIHMFATLGKMFSALLVGSAFLATAMVLSACGNDRSEAATAAYPYLILGDWSLHTAYRNERQTSSLEGTFFRFLNEQHVSTNLPLSGRPGVGAMHAGYTLEGDSLYLYPHQLPVIPFHILHLDSQQLVMTALLVNQEFRFDLVREDDPTPHSGNQTMDD
jgi:hypothetical protein